VEAKTHNRIAILIASLSVVVSAAALWHSSRRAKLWVGVVPIKDTHQFRENWFQDNDHYTQRATKVQLTNKGRAAGHQNSIIISAPEGAWFVAAAGFGEFCVDAGNGVFKPLRDEVLRIDSKPTQLRVQLGFIAPGMRAELAIAWVHETKTEVDHLRVFAYGEEGIAREQERP